MINMVSKGKKIKAKISLINICKERKNKMIDRL